MAVKNIAIIGARLNSSRLPGKHLLPLDGTPLISRLIERLKLCQNIDLSVLATTDDSFNQPLVDEVAGNIQAVTYSGDVNDLMGRIDSIVDLHQPDNIVYICGDCPLVDPGFIDHALAKLMASSMETVKLKAGVKSIHEGIALYSYEGWKKLIDISNCTMSREHVGYAEKLTPTLKVLEIDDSANFSTIKHRISVDTLADYQFMQKVYSRWYNSHLPSSIVELKWVMDQLQLDPSLSDINNHVIQKSANRAYQKVSLYCQVSEKVGMGHLSRCVEIATALQELAGLGTVIHIIGPKTQLPWLPSNVRWYATEATLFHAMSMDNNPLWILDFHPTFITLQSIVDCIQSVKSERQVNTIALDKLGCLLDFIDILFIPSFYNKKKHPKVVSGWENYLFKPVSTLNKSIPLLVMTGGSDALGYGKTLPKLLERWVPKTIQIHWVQGPYATPPILPSSERWIIHKNPSNIKELMAQSSNIFTCYGLSLFEAIASDALTLLLPPMHLCEDEELGALIDTKTCIVCQNSDELKQNINNLFCQPNKFKEIKIEAKKVSNSINGLKVITAKVQELLTLPLIK